MNYNNPPKNGSTIIIRVMCAIVFILFSFCWLYFFEADVMQMAQHVLSGGLTHYNRLVGAIVLTLLLYLLQVIITHFVKLMTHAYALSYFPSMLLLAMLTSVRQLGSSDITHDFSWWGVALVSVLWLFLVFLAHIARELDDDRQGAGLFSRQMWINILLMSLMIMGVAWIGNSNAVFHYRMAVEKNLLEGDVEDALKVGRKSLESDHNLLMLRMYALARHDELGEHLFEYPVTGNSDVMLPTGGLSGMLLYPVDSLYRYLGARPGEKLAPMRYLTLLQRRDSLPHRKAVDDYLLCGLLIDRQLDRFASEVGRRYQINDSLPKHYREALILYRHQRAHPVVVYHHAVMDEDYDNLQALKKEYPRRSEQHVKVEEQYNGTYWYYYEYGEK